MSSENDQTLGDIRNPRLTSDPESPLRINMVSLGCPKALVDSEVILGHMGMAGHMITGSAEDADVVVINTCGFIDNAKEESIQAILQACEWKQQGIAPQDRKVIVTGCLAQRYAENLRQEIPEVDAIIGLGEQESLSDVLNGLATSRAERNEPLVRIRPQDEPCNKDVGRFRLTPQHFAYVKISEGCDNPCTFCSIPSIRGGFRSKPIPAIVDEVKELVDTGAKEIVLISQDTTSYGIDLYGRYELAQLLNSIAKVDGVEWIRILYAYPAFLTDEMIDAIASIDKVTKYLDMPLQHISDKMLRHMGRRLTEVKTRRLLDKLREQIPGIYLRTTFIVGFPGEDDTEFGILRDFVRDFAFERLGVFTYSQEEGTPSATFEDQVSEEIMQTRLEELMLVQQENAFAQNRRRLGETTTVLIDEIDPKGANDENSVVWATGRSFGEAPEIDPVIAVRALRQAAALQVGRLVPVKIVDTRDYDLLAQCV